MQTFKDSAGSEWRIALPFGEIERVRADSKNEFDLLDPHVNNLATRMMRDIRLFWEVLAYLVTPQFAGRTAVEEVAVVPYSAKHFGQSMGPAELVGARLLFMKEWADFFRLLQRPDLAESIEGLLTVQATAVEVMLEKIATDTTLRDLAGNVKPAMIQAVEKSYSDLQATLASILNRTPGEPSTSEQKESDKGSEPGT